MICIVRFFREVIGSSRQSVSAILNSRDVLDCEIEAVVIATQLEGQLRDGHLNREMHGAAVKNREVPEAALEAFRQAASVG